MKMEMKYVYRCTIQFFNLVCMLHAIFCLATYLMMDDSRRKALRQCQQDLRMLIRVNDFLLSLHVHAGGFLNDAESDSIRKHKGYVKQVDELVDILVTKENKDFDHFCIILEKNGHHVSSEKLRKAAGLGERQQPSCMVTLVTLFFLAMLCMIH